MRLYTDGSRAYARILECIDRTRQSLQINMFLWRDDEIGRRIAEAVLSAADRGVQCDILLDRAGSCHEYAEGSRRSLFHPKQSLAERLRTLRLSLGRGLPGRPTGTDSPLARRFLNHPNIRLERDRVRRDHTCFFLFDDNRVIFGGMSIEDSRNTADARGMPFRDCMIEAEGRRLTDSFLRKWERYIDPPEDPFFFINRKEPVRRFEIAEQYLRLASRSRSHLIIVMGCFSHLSPLLDAMLRAADRGAAVTVLLPEHAEFGNNANRRTARMLLKKSKGTIRVFFSPDRFRTRLMISDGVVCTGSCDLTRRSMQELDGLNVLTRDPELTRAVREEVERSLSHAREVRNPKEIRYSRIRARIEQKRL